MSHIQVHTLAAYEIYKQRNFNEISPQINFDIEYDFVHQNQK